MNNKIAKLLNYREGTNERCCGNCKSFSVRCYNVYKCLKFISDGRIRSFNVCDKWEVKK